MPKCHFNKVVLFPENIKKPLAVYSGKHIPSALAQKVP